MTQPHCHPYTLLFQIIATDGHPWLRFLYPHAILLLTTHLGALALSTATCPPVARFINQIALLLPLLSLSRMIHLPLHLHSQEIWGRSPMSVTATLHLTKIMGPPPLHLCLLWAITLTHPLLIVNLVVLVFGHMISMQTRWILDLGDVHLSPISIAPCWRSFKNTFTSSLSPWCFTIIAGIGRVLASSFVNGILGMGTQNVVTGWLLFGMRSQVKNLLWMTCSLSATFVTVLFLHRSILLLFHTRSLLTWRGRRIYTNTAYLFLHTASSFCFLDLSMDLANS